LALIRTRMILQLYGAFWKRFLGGEQIAFRWNHLDA
jgi:hypothetical protein